jgi:hypothetical protein
MGKNGVNGGMESKKVIKKIILISIGIFSVFHLVEISINTYYEKKSLYNERYNTIRLKLGIPIIENNMNDIDNRPLIWKDTTNVHRLKMVFIESQNINKEIDVFYYSKDSILHITSKYNRRSKELISKEIW